MCIWTGLNQNSGEEVPEKSIKSAASPLIHGLEFGLRVSTLRHINGYRLMDERLDGPRITTLSLTFSVRANITAHTSTQFTV